MCFIQYKILFSKNQSKIYIGYTSNLIMRFHSHNMRSTKGWTHNFRPWIVIYCEYFTDRAKAQKREKQLKGAIGREWIWKKIETELNRKVFISASGGLGFNSRSRYKRALLRALFCVLYTVYILFSTHIRRFILAILRTSSIGFIHIMNSAKKTGPVNFVHGLLFIVNTSMIREKLQDEKGN